MYMGLQLTCALNECAYRVICRGTVVASRSVRAEPRNGNSEYSYLLGCLFLNPLLLHNVLYKKKHLNMRFSHVLSVVRLSQWT
jgi:hypothetical protein